MNILLKIKYVLFVSSFALPFAAIAQESCSAEDQNTLDQCVLQAIQVCRADVFSNCERHAATVSGALTKFQSKCCTAKNGQARSEKGYRLCRRAYLIGTRRVARKLFPSDFADAVRGAIRGSELSNCE